MSIRHVNKADLATLMGVTSVTIGQWVRQGCPFLEKGTQGKSWVFDVPEVVTWRAERFALQAVGDTKSLDIDEARRRKLAAEAALAELDVSKRKGEIVEIEIVAQTVGDDYANLRAKLIALPTKVAPQVCGLEDAAQVKEIIAALVSEALEELVSDGVYEGIAAGSEATETDEPKAAA